MKTRQTSNQEAANTHEGAKISRVQKNQDTLKCHHEKHQTYENCGTVNQFLNHCFLFFDQKKNY